MSKFKKLSRYFFRAITGAYALGIILFLLLHFLIGERWMPVAFLNTFAQLVLLPSFVLLPICLLMREWRFAAAISPAVIFFALTWGNLFLPNTAVQAGGDEANLRILSYNIGAYGQDPAEVIELIRLADADIVTLQELGIQYAQAIESQLSDLYPYMALHPQGITTQGQGVLSRFPLSEDSYWQYDFLRSPLGHQRVYIEEFSLALYNLHPTHPGMNGNIFNPSFRSMELTDILERSTAEENHVILVGDFNMPDLSDDYRAIRALYRDAFLEVGQGLGWTYSLSHSPAFLRLDYLFYREGIRPLSAQVLGDRWGSDHHPLLVELALSR